MDALSLSKFVMEQPNQDIEVPPGVLACVSSPGGRIHVEFGLGNEIHCCGVRKGPPQEANSKHLAPPRDARIGGDAGDSEDARHSSPASTSVAWGRLGPIQRRIAYDTCDKYVEYACAKNIELHRRNKRRGGTKNSGVGSYGNELEYVFAQAVSEILGASVSGGLGGVGDCEEYDALCVVEEKALWELVCSFVFVDDENGGYRGAGGLGIDLGGWYYGNATSMCLLDGEGRGVGDGHPFSLETQSRLQGLDVPELDVSFWITFLRLVAIGWISDALDLLAMHSAWLHWDSSTDERTPGDVAVLENMSLLLRRFPTIRGRGGSGADAASNTLREFDDVHELMLARKSWLAQVRELKGDAELWTACSTKAPETMRACLACLDVLMGDEAAILKAVSPVAVGEHAANFCELLIAKTTHVYPDLGSLSELQQLLGQCEEALPPSNVFQEAVALIIRHSCHMDHQAVIKGCSFVVSDWFLAHITIVLQAHPSGPGGLDRVMTHLGSDQCEFYRLDYACSLAANPLTWHMAARYMGFCEHHGRGAFEAMMSRLRLGVDGRVAWQAINLAREYGMEHLCARIQQQQGAVCWHAGLIGIAAQWFSMGGDFASADKCLAQIADPDGDAEAIDDVRECIEALEDFDTSPNMHILRNRALLLAQIAGHRKDFSGATAVLRRVDRRLGLECMRHLTDSIPDITPGVLEKEDLLLLLDLVNNVDNDTAAVLQARLSILRLLAD